jgi:hypothetical protein
MADQLGSRACTRRGINGIISGGTWGRLKPVQELSCPLNRSQTAELCSQTHPALDSVAIVTPRCHCFRKANRSALMVSACVVGMPCGKPL